MDFGFLFDPSAEALLDRLPRHATARSTRATTTCSPPRRASTSFVAIAKGDVPAEHWFRLGRAADARRAGLGARLLVGVDVRVPDAGARDARAGRQPARPDVPARRRAARSSYGGERGVPWGISESAFNARDLELTYQYSNFGVPGLGLKRGLARGPRRRALRDGARRRWSIRAAAVRNFGAPRRRGRGRAVRLLRGARLHAAPAPGRRRGRGRARVHGPPPGHGARGDRQRPRRRRDARRASTPSRSSRRPSCCSRSGRRATSPSPGRARRRRRAPADVRDLVPPVLRRFTSPHDAMPRTHLLSNGRYAVMVTAAGSGYSRWRGIAVTRWREDVTRDCVGHATSSCATAERRGLVGRLTSRAAPRPDSYEVIYSEDRVEIRPARRRDRDRARASSCRPSTTPRSAGCR